MNEIKIIDGKIYQRQDFGLVKADVEVASIKADKRGIEYDGGKIPLALAKSIMAFLKWTYDEFKAESLVRLYYDSDTKRWFAHAFPQKMRLGLSVTDDMESPEAIRQREALPQGVNEMGTWHHHCGISAFQSGTDEKDEITKPGLHITSGNLNSSEWTFHARVSFQKVMYEADLSTWFECPEELEKYSGKLKHMAIQEILVTPPAEGTIFNETWKTNCTRYVAPAVLPAVTGQYSRYQSVSGETNGSQYGGYDYYRRYSRGNYNLYGGGMDVEEYAEKAGEVAAAELFKVVETAKELYSQELIDSEILTQEEYDADMASLDVFCQYIINEAWYDFGKAVELSFMKEIREGKETQTIEDEERYIHGWQ